MHAWHVSSLKQLIPHKILHDFFMLFLQALCVFNKKHLWSNEPVSVCCCFRSVIFSEDLEYSSKRWVSGARLLEGSSNPLDLVSQPSSINNNHLSLPFCLSLPSILQKSDARELGGRERARFFPGETLLRSPWQHNTTLSPNWLGGKKTKPHS